MSEVWAYLQLLKEEEEVAARLRVVRAQIEARERASPEILNLKRSLKRLTGQEVSFEEAIEPKNDQEEPAKKRKRPEKGGKEGDSALKKLEKKLNVERKNARNHLKQKFLNNKPETEKEKVEEAIRAYLDLGEDFPPGLLQWIEDNGPLDSDEVGDILREYAEKEIEEAKMAVEVANKN